MNPISLGELLLEAVDLATEMFNAARRGDTPTLEKAIQHGLLPNMTNNKGDSRIMLAAYHGHADLVKILLRHEADPNRLNDRGQSPLSGAVFKKEDAVVEALLENCADPEFRAPDTLQCIEMFKQQDTWKAKFECAPGRGTMRAHSLAR